MAGFEAPSQHVSGTGKNLRLRKAKQILGWTMVVLGGAAILAAWFWWATAERRSIQAMPAEQRLALYQSTLETIKRVCLPPAPNRDAFKSYCMQQGDFISYFPECEGACQTMADRLALGADLAR
jgi:hypothetical protein